MTSILNSDSEGNEIVSRELSGFAAVLNQVHAYHNPDTKPKRAGEIVAGCHGIVDILARQSELDEQEWNSILKVDLFLRNVKS